MRAHTLGCYGVRSASRHLAPQVFISVAFAIYPSEAHSTLFPITHSHSNSVVTFCNLTLPQPLRSALSLSLSLASIKSSPSPLTLTLQLTFSL